MSLKDVTLIVPYRFDTPARKRNFDIVTSYFGSSDATLLPVEQSGSKIPRDPHSCFWLYSFRDDPNTPFHKTRLINQGLSHVETPLVGVLDTDVLCDLNSLQAAADALSSNQADLVYPYDGTFLEVPEVHIDSFVRRWALGYRSDPRTLIMAQDSMGGLFLTTTACFRELGGANERFVSWGPEDQEIAMRYARIGRRIARVPGPLWHLEHPRSENSGPNHPNYFKNAQEWTRLMSLDSSSEWALEIEGFPWRSRL